MVQSKRQKEENKRAIFFSARKQKTVVDDSTSSEILNCHVQETSNEGCDEATFPTSVGHCDDDVLVVDNPPIPVELHTADIVNNLDFNDDDGECLESDDDDVDDGDENSGVQQDYVRAIQKRLQAEISGDHDGPQWLLDELKRDLFWIRSHRAHFIVSKTVDDIPQGHHIIVPISMIKEHVDSVEVRATPIDSDKNMIGMTLPASEFVERDILDTISSDEDVEGREHIADDADASATHDESGDEDIDDLTAQLTSREIDHLQMAIFDKENALSRRIPLESAHLSPPPNK